MHVPYFIKEHLWMKASEDATLKKKFWWKESLLTVDLRNKMVS